MCLKRLMKHSKYFLTSETIFVNFNNYTHQIQFMASGEPGVEGFAILDDIYFSAWLCDSPSGCSKNGSNPTTPFPLPTTKNPIAVTTKLTQKPTTVKGTTKLTQRPTTAKPMTTRTPPPPVVSKNVCKVVPCDFRSKSFRQVKKQYPTTVDFVSFVLQLYKQ